MPARRWWIASAKRWADGCGIALPFTTHRSMEVGSTKLRLRLASSLVNAWEDEGLGISPHCAAKPDLGIALPFTTHRSMEVGSTKLRLRLASSLVNAWEDEGLGISPHCAAKPEPGIAASTATNSQSGGGSPESKRASSLITQSSGHGTSGMKMAESFNRRRTSIGGCSLSRWSLRSENPAMLARFFRQDSDGNFGPEGVCRSVSRRLLGHGFEAIPAPCGSSLFCFR